jgi:hypothetical protein
MSEDYFYFDEDGNVIFRPTGDCLDNSNLLFESTIERLNEILSKVVIVKSGRFNDLCESEQWLTALESAGVDNWSGYEYAQELIQEWDSQND